MKVYRRISGWPFTRVTEVDEAGCWRTWAEWPDGSKTGYAEATLEAMGWHSLTEFLRERKGFRLTG